MNNEEIDYLVKTIDQTEAKIKAGVDEITGTPDNLLKVHRLLELLGEASGELAFVKEQMTGNKKPIRKFALLRKTA